VVLRKFKLILFGCCFMIVFGFEEITCLKFEKSFIGKVKKIGG